ncbi:MAG: polyphosphate kinase 1 [Anaerolineales bacterium]|nr:polyphosphate kinase 1 [Anaerolineales bacterium]MCB0012978.1 polyphosphate kinase 1 [Anaerolineales bacterium]MCB0018110.1 polyphosphate kinase 1 [Anaerolineales bacterium]
MSKNAASADAIKNHVATVVEEVRLQAAPPPIVAEPVDETDYFDPSLYINRELSILEFQRRVLGECVRDKHPLLERLKFLAIFHSNVDEFFMVRVSGIRQQILLGITDTAADGLLPREQLVAIHRTVVEMVEQATQIWSEVMQPALKDEGIHVLNYDQLKKSQQKRLRSYFDREIFPVLTPLAFDVSHPFPHISNLSINLAVVIKDPDSQVTRFARVKVPNIVSRLVPLTPIDPDELLTPKIQKFVWIEQVIAANLDRLFPGMEIIAAHPFRVTRNTDMEIQEEEADDLLLTMEENLRLRHFGRPVRLETDETMPDWIRDILMENLQVGPYDVYTIDGPLSLTSLWELHGLERPQLKDSPLYASTPIQLVPGENIFNILRQQDVLLHHPYDSFLPVIDFLEQAATDPDVLAIKQTLYRVGPKPPVVDALRHARENGKQVTVLVELKARFDEESNIEWARALEASGVHVVYGLVGLKTHCKMTLVVRREREGIRRYVHVATGNYNANTARLYTDIGLMSADEDLGADATELFNYLTGYSKQEEYRKFLVAPVNMRQKLMDLIERETAHGKDGYIAIKGNSLVDAPMIRALYKAAKAGVRIDLIIRGICCLRPGLPGLSETIHVRSVVGRFLEHSRIYYFHNQGSCDVYVGSADPMPRNLNRRVEVLFPIEDKALKREIVDVILATYLRDNQQAHVLQADGSYRPLRHELGTNDESFSSQDDFIEEHRVEYSGD